MPVKRSRICKGCWQQMRVPVPLRGLASAPFRMVGIRPSRMNPNTCTFCELMFTRIMRARNITVDVTVLFVDLRGYTALSESLPADAMADVIDSFYDECAGPIWENDGLLNKTIGDAVMAIFNFPISRDDHPGRAVAAARAIRRGFADHKRALPVDPERLGVGIGIDSGAVSFGEFGHAHRDLTAIGSVVNRAARIQAAALPGEILVSGAVRERTPGARIDGAARAYELKGFEAPVRLYSA